MSVMKISGIFRALTDNSLPRESVNEITPEGIQRILQLMGGHSTTRWSAIRLVSADPQVFSQKPASFTVHPGKLISSALFTSADVSFDVVSVEMYAGTTRVAFAPMILPSGQTYYIEREDMLEYIPGGA